MLFSWLVGTYQSLSGHFAHENAMGVYNALPYLVVIHAI